MRRFPDRLGKAREVLQGIRQNCGGQWREAGPRDDPEKFFGPGTFGVIFGVQYTTTLWHGPGVIPRKKMAMLATQIKQILRLDELRQWEIQSVVGRIVYL